MVSVLASEVSLSSLNAEVILSLQISSGFLLIQVVEMFSFCLHVQILLLFLISVAFAKTCYNPDGSPLPGSIADVQPCVLTSGAHSMCCATLRSEFTDTCLPNGLCNDGAYWRDFCTDPSWNSPFCLKGVCTDDSVRSRRDPFRTGVKRDSRETEWRIIEWRGGNVPLLDRW